MHITYSGGRGTEKIPQKISTGTVTTKKPVYRNFSSPRIQLGENDYEFFLPEKYLAAVTAILKSVKSYRAMIFNLTTK